MMKLMETKRKRGQPKKHPTKVVGVRVLLKHHEEAKKLANEVLGKYKQK